MNIKACYPCFVKAEENVIFLSSARTSQREKHLATTCFLQSWCLTVVMTEFGNGTKTFGFSGVYVWPC